MNQAERDAYNVGPWRVNRVQCFSCKAIVDSVNKNDFNYCRCGKIAVDGGSWYLRRVRKSWAKYRELSVEYADVIDVCAPIEIRV